MLEQTMEQLAQMHLTGMLAELRSQLESPKYHSIPFEERLALLVDREFLKRKNSALQHRLKQSRIKPNATIENIDFTIMRKLDRAQFMSLAGLSWLGHHNLIISGQTGLGKTFLAQALVDKACRLGYKALCIKTHELLSTLLIARADGTYPKVAARLTALPLLVLDEWLRDPLSGAQAREILDLFDLKYQSSSAIFVSQLAVDDWHAQIQDPAIADALLDRIVHNSHRVSLLGESVRKLQALNRSTRFGIKTRF